MTLQELADAIAAKEGWKAAARLGAVVLTLSVGPSRKQSVHLSQFDHEDAGMVRFTTRVGPAKALDPNRCRTALELNGRFPTGCLAIEGDSLIMTETRPLKTTTPESSARAVRFLATQADTYERFIYKKDEH